MVFGQIVDRMFKQTTGGVKKDGEADDGSGSTRQEEESKKE